MKKETIIQWKKENKMLSKDMTKWRESYNCRNDCKDWQEHKFCNHLVNAREKKFGERINNNLNIVMEMI